MMEEIRICDCCSGTGQVKEWEAGHNPDFYFVDCSLCNGTGRIIKKTYVTVAPYGKKIDYERDRVIHSLLKELYKDPEDGS